MRTIFYILIFCLIPALLNSQTNTNEKEMLEKIDKIVSELTIEEKVSLCSGRDAWSTKPVERLNIPWIWLADGPHGVRRAPATDKPGYGDQIPATCFPTSSALAASWDVDLIYDVGQAIGEECQALDVNLLLGPGVNIKRSILGGRNFEYYSEDPILAGEMAAAFINGVQSQGVGTSLKHYVANNVETNRMFANSDVDLRTLHEIYLTPFEIAVKKAQPLTVMACYNRVRGVYGTQNHFLLTNVLRNDWEFKGIVISDWFAVINRVEAMRAGLNIEMPYLGKVNDSLAVKAVKNGELPEATVDSLVKDILKIVFTAKLREKEDAVFDADKHHEFARYVASQTVTLLKNDNRVLPVNSKKYKKIAVIGEFAESPRYQGNGSSEVKPTKIDNVLGVLHDEYNNEFEIKYSQGYSLSNDNDFSLINRAKEVASNADIALLFVGLPLHYESEGIDRKHIDMPASHNELIKEIGQVQDNVVVVLTNGSAVAMPWINEVDAVVESWLGGQAGAGGTTDVLFGKVNPSGKLAETFPVKLEDTPAYLNFPDENGEVLYGERIFVGYRYFDEKGIEPLFPFGHGLSYTTFEYSNLELSDKITTDKNGLEINVTVGNTGKVRGKEVVQLYITDKESTLRRPAKELKKFAKVDLEPGEKKTIAFKLEGHDFSYFDSKRNMWVAESGEFNVNIGSSSRDIRLSKEFTLRSTQQIPLAFDEYTFFRDYWENPETRSILLEYLPVWIRNFTGDDIDGGVIPDFMIDHPLIKYPYISGGEMTSDDVMEIVERCRDLTFIP
jgi:beta-glucosidase